MLEFLVKLVLLPIWLPLKVVGELLEHSWRRSFYRPRRSYRPRRTVVRRIQAVQASGSVTDIGLALFAVVLPGTPSWLAFRRMRGIPILVGFILSLALAQSYSVALLVAAGFWLWGMADWAYSTAHRDELESLASRE